ncbi:MAG: IS200/IS605 family transposase, partial [Patescibacteria group bacterium]
ISEIGIDQNHIHILCQFLPKYSGGQVIRLIKSMTARKIFKYLPEVKKELWGGEFWTDGYYISTISNKGNRETIAKYIRNQGREKNIKQLQLFNI